MIFRKTPFAINSLREHAFYLEENATPAIAERYLYAVEQTLDFITTHPEIGSPCDLPQPRLQNMRRWPVRDFEKYLLFYQPANEDLLLLYVFHSKQDIDSILTNPPGEI